MTIAAPTLTAEAVQAVIHGCLPQPAEGGLAVEAVDRGSARVRMLFKPWMIRPGNVISGPALFTVADTAMFALLVAHLGADISAVTSDLTVHFLSPAKPGDVTAEASLLKLGRRLAVIEVSMFTAGDPTLVARLTGSYVILRT